MFSSYKHSELRTTVSTLSSLEPLFKLVEDYLYVILHSAGWKMLGLQSNASKKETVLPLSKAIAIRAVFRKQSINQSIFVYYIVVRPPLLTVIHSVKPYMKTQCQKVIRQVRYHKGEQMRRITLHTGWPKKSKPLSRIIIK